MYVPHYLRCFRQRYVFHFYHSNTERKQKHTQSTLLIAPNSDCQTYEGAARPLQTCTTRTRSARVSAHKHRGKGNQNPQKVRTFEQGSVRARFPLILVSLSSMGRARPSSHVLWKMESKVLAKVIPKAIKSQGNQLHSRWCGWGSCGADTGWQDRGPWHQPGSMLSTEMSCQQSCMSWRLGG